MNVLKKITDAIKFMAEVINDANHLRAEMTAKHRANGL